MPIYRVKKPPFDGGSHARIDPVRSGNSTELNGFLRSTFNAQLETSFFNFPKRRGKWVVEVKREATSSANGVGAGVCNSSMSGSTWLGADANGVCLYSKNYGIYASGGQVSSTPAWGDSDDSYVMAVDLTGNNPVLSFVLNNEDSIDTAYTWTGLDLRTADCFLAISGSTNDSITLNTGRLPWINQHIRRLFPDYNLGWQAQRPKPITYLVSDTGAFTLTADSGAYTYTGTNAGVEKGSNLAADTDSYTYSGTNADLNRGYTIAADTDSYVYTGTNATLTFAGAGAFTLEADSGSYTYTGTNAGLKAAFSLAADTDSYTYNGTNVALSRGYYLSADTDAYNYSGASVDFSLDAVLNAETVSYNYTGSNVSITVQGDLVVGDTYIYTADEKIVMTSSNETISMKSSDSKIVI